MILPLSARIDLLTKLGQYLLSDDAEWEQVKAQAFLHNSWFIPTFIETATQALATQFLAPEPLGAWTAGYRLQEPAHPRTVGLVMAGNLPAVGFHDLLCGFVSGHRLHIKTASKDNILIPHFITKLKQWAPEVDQQLVLAERLNGCDAYIATGSNNSARYFQQYFGPYPHIIRRNRTSVAVLDGTETPAELRALTDDLLLYFGRGCRNVTQLLVPEGYDFQPLLAAMDDYAFLQDVHHYKNNFDYQLSLLLLNRSYYMTNNTVLLREHPSPFSAVSVVHYTYYSDPAAVRGAMEQSGDLQCIVGHGQMPFGSTQTPGLSTYADGVDTLAFLQAL